MGRLENNLVLQLTATIMARYAHLMLLGIMVAILSVFAMLAVLLGAKRAKGPFADADVASLAEAAKAGDCEQIDKLIARKVNVNAQGKGGITPLLYSMDGGSAEGFERLLVHGADPNLEDDTGRAAIHYAAFHENPEFLKTALAHGGDANLRAQPRFMPEPDPVVPCDRSITAPTPVFVAARSHNPENVRILINAGADLDARDDDGKTPLMYAASAHAFDAMLVLLEAGADFRLKDNRGLPVSSAFTTDYDSVDPNSPVAAARQRCREFMEKGGVDFEQEKIENEKRLEKIREWGQRQGFPP
jgi:ankyrin repeat protein